MVDRDELTRANTKAMRRRAATPRAIEAHFDRRLDRVVIRLSTGIDVAFSARDAQGLEKAKPNELSEIEISPSGFGLHFPKLDADIYLPALLEGFLGSKRWMAARLGQEGGKVRSAAKRAASRANGKLGGRPRRKVSSG